MFGKKKDFPKQLPKCTFLQCQLLNSIIPRGGPHHFWIHSKSISLVGDHNCSCCIRPFHISTQYIALTSVSIKWPHVLLTHIRFYLVDSSWFPTPVTTSEDIPRETWLMILLSNLKLCPLFPSIPIFVCWRCQLHNNPDRYIYCRPALH